MDLDTIMDRLEGLLDRSVRIPLTRRVLINEDDYLRLVDQIRANGPDEIRKARQVEAERDVLLQQAAQQAEAMVAKGRQTASDLVGDHAVVAQAQERAKEILRTAERHAADVKSDADEYALRVLEELAARLQDFGRVIDNGIDWLREREPGAHDPLADEAIEPNIIDDGSEPD